MMHFETPHPKRTHRLRVAVLMLLLGIVAVSCGGSKDDRDEIRSRLGEPDSIDFTEGPYYDIEVWSFYDEPQPGMTKWYEFHQSKNSCGGGSTWSLYMSGTIGSALQSDLEQMSQNEVVASDAPEETAVTPPPDTP